MSILNDFFRQHASMKICMMGPWGVGKTTILTSIFHDTNKYFASTKLNFNPDKETLSILSDRLSNLLDIFGAKTFETEHPKAGMLATPEESKFLFTLGLKGKPACVDLEITDFPGEWVDPKHANNGMVTQYIKESQVLMIAIDTVHLMEEGGVYNEIKNRSSYLSHHVLTCLQELDPREEKMILLVPLKCEKYMYENRMEEVASSVKEAYKEFITKMKGDYSNRISCAITPIITLGGVVFSHFGKNSDGRIEIDSLNACPKAVHYAFYSKSPSYNPLFCIQPLYYLLSFVTKQYKATQENGNLLERLRNNLALLFSSDKNFFGEIEKLSDNIKKNGNGYVIINDNNKI